MTAALSRSRGGSANNAGSSASEHAMRDEPLPRIGAAREEAERRPHRRRCVVERAANASAPRSAAGYASTGGRASRGSPPNMTTVPPGRTSSTASNHACSVPAASITTSAPRPSPGSRAELVRERPPLLAAADDHRPAAGVGDARREHQPDRPGAEDRDRVARLHPRALDAAQAARERLDHRRDLGRETGRHVVQVDGSDPLRNDEPVRVGAGEEQKLAALLAARAAVARAARRRVRGDDAATVDEPAELVPERRGRLAQRAADAHGDTSSGRCRRSAPPRSARAPRPGPASGFGHVLDAQVARRVQPRRLHGVNTTFSASPRRYRSTPSANRSSGRIVTVGQNERRQQLDRRVEIRRVAEREPTTRSSLR